MSSSSEATPSTPKSGSSFCLSLPSERASDTLRLYAVEPSITLIEKQMKLNSLRDAHSNRSESSYTESRLSLSNDSQPVDNLRRNSKGAEPAYSGAQEDQYSFENNLGEFLNTVIPGEQEQLKQSGLSKVLCCCSIKPSKRLPDNSKTLVKKLLAFSAVKYDDNVPLHSRLVFNLYESLNLGSIFKVKIEESFEFVTAYKDSRTTLRDHLNEDNGMLSLFFVSYLTTHCRDKFLSTFETIKSSSYPCPFLLVLSEITKIFLTLLKSPRFHLALVDSTDPVLTCCRVFGGLEFAWTDVYLQKHVPWRKSKSTFDSIRSALFRRFEDFILIGKKFEQSDSAENLSNYD